MYSFIDAVLSERMIDFNSLIGLEIVDLIKVSYETYQEHLDYLEEVDLKGYNDKESFFKYGYGSLLVVFDDIQFSFGSSEDLNSIIVSCEKNFKEVNPKYILDDKDVLDATSIFDLDINDFSFVGSKIVSIDILSRKKLNSKEQGLPSDLGIIFNLDNNHKLVISHSLLESNFMFSVLFSDKELKNYKVKHNIS